MNSFHSNFLELLLCKHIFWHTNTHTQNNSLSPLMPKLSEVINKQTKNLKWQWEKIMVMLCGGKIISNFQYNILCLIFLSLCSFLLDVSIIYATHMFTGKSKIWWGMEHRRGNSVFWKLEVSLTMTGIFNTEGKIKSKAVLESTENKIESVTLSSLCLCNH